MDDQEILAQMRYRRSNIEKSVSLQTHQPTKQILQDELVYCNLQIEYREKYGDGSKFYVKNADEGVHSLPRV